MSNLEEDIRAIRICLSEICSSLKNIEKEINEKIQTKLSCTPNTEYNSFIEFM